MKTSSILLGVNIDHVATLRQARGTPYPDPIKAALLAEQAGADGITLHLREDRRHIQDHDVQALKTMLQTKMNLEMAATEAMINFAVQVQPECCCLVPEKRAELTTEGGLDVIAKEAALTIACKKLAAANIEVSFFIDPNITQVDAARRCGAPTIEIHTGHYADATTAEEKEVQRQRIAQCAEYAHALGLHVNAGHGLHYDNVQPIAAIDVIHELNIGHSIIARAIFVGISEAVREMKCLLLEGRKGF